MELQRVKYFLALCEANSFCQAAKQCGIAQPSLTAAIQRLERSIGGHLFERRPTTRPTYVVSCDGYPSKRGRPMTTKTVVDFGADTAIITAAFFVRNAVVLIGLSVFVLIAFAR